MTAKTRFLFAAMMVVALPSVAPSIAVAADPPATIKSLLNTCNACHGAKGVSSIA